MTSVRSDYSINQVMPVSCKTSKYKWKPHVASFWLQCGCTPSREVLMSPMIPVARRWPCMMKLRRSCRQGLWLDPLLERPLIRIQYLDVEALCLPRDF